MHRVEVAKHPYLPMRMYSDAIRNVGWHTFNKYRINFVISPDILIALITRQTDCDTTIDVINNSNVNRYALKNRRKIVGQ